MTYNGKLKRILAGFAAAFVLLSVPIEGMAAWWSRKPPSSKERYTPPSKPSKPSKPAPPPSKPPSGGSSGGSTKKPSTPTTPPRNKDSRSGPSVPDEPTRGGKKADPPNNNKSGADKKRDMIERSEAAKKQKEAIKQQREQAAKKAKEAEEKKKKDQHRNMTGLDDGTGGNNGNGNGKKVESKHDKKIKETANKNINQNNKDIRDGKFRPRENPTKDYGPPVTTKPGKNTIPPKNESTPPPRNSKDINKNNGGNGGGSSSRRDDYDDDNRSSGSSSNNSSSSNSNNNSSTHNHNNTSGGGQVAGELLVTYGKNNDYHNTVRTGRGTVNFTTQGYHIENPSDNRNMLIDMCEQNCKVTKEMTLYEAVLKMSNGNKKVAEQMLKDEMLMFIANKELTQKNGRPTLFPLDGTKKKPSDFFDPNHPENNAKAIESFNKLDKATKNGLSSGKFPTPLIGTGNINKDKDEDCIFDCDYTPPGGNGGGGGGGGRPGGGSGTSRHKLKPPPIDRTKPRIPWTPPDPDDERPYRPPTPPIPSEPTPNTPTQTPNTPTPTPKPNTPTPNTPTPNNPTPNNPPPTPPTPPPPAVPDENGVIVCDVGYGPKTERVKESKPVNKFFEGATSVYLEITPIKPIGFENLSLDQQIHWEQTHEPQIVGPIDTSFGEYIENTKGVLVEVNNLMNSGDSDGAFELFEEWKVGASEAINVDIDELKIDFSAKNQEGFARGGVFTIVEMAQNASVSTLSIQEYEKKYDCVNTLVETNEEHTDENGNPYVIPTKKYVSVYNEISSTPIGTPDEYSNLAIHYDDYAVSSSYQLLNVRCNKTEFDKLVAKTNATVLSNALSSSTAKSPVVHDKVATFFDNTTIEFFYNGQDCKNVFTCTANPNPNSAGDSKNNVGNSGIKVNNKFGAQFDKKSSDKFTFFRDNLPKKTRIDVWYPQGISNNGIVNNPNAKPSATFITLDPSGTPNGDMFNLLDENGNILLSGKALGSKNAVVIKGEANKVLWQSSWASEKSKPHKMNVRYAYKPSISSTNIESITIDGVTTKTTDFSIDLYCTASFNTTDAQPARIVNMPKPDDYRAISKFNNNANKYIEVEFVKSSVE